MDRDGDVEVFAHWGGTPEYGIYTNVLRQYWLTGPARLGGAIDLHYHAEPGQTPDPVLVWLFGAFAKISPTVYGSYGWMQIDPGEVILLGSYSIPAQGGDALCSVPLPSSTALQGVQFCSQPIELRGSRLRIGSLVETLLGQ